MPKLKRSTFLATLFGVPAAAQQAKDPAFPTTTTTMCVGSRAPRDIRSITFPGASLCKIPNGECPLCGTVAKPHAPGMIFNLADFCLDRDGRETACSKAPRVVRCQTCNGAFWMDAEAE